MTSILGIEHGQGYIAKIETHSFVDGEGVRCSVYVSGCPFQCLDCYNKAAQHFKYGEPFTEKILQEILSYCEPGYISGLSILGGEPFCNLDVTLRLVQAFRQRFGQTKTIWIWTGFQYEYLSQDKGLRFELLEYVDVLVDGMFITQLYRPNLPYKGSLNQRVIDVNTSLQRHQLCEYIYSGPSTSHSF
ncbi:anaerobic ribonucleoside-triphosphate reductase activating protein [Staphylococcus warneri]|uniref:anaerobic ribonucleoside-triphosphate reductase activating protein n=1 Tax=Staphylococcus warneri TaxID=1292 RepID=UPI000D1D230A|nr:anaerobic ribonucleoside-triphosphate reductase activating protein [Staphylococcus warneri]MBE9429555.1 anaerobic ribonucleoside-triphosphate reductase activating protein [Staphylococcus epidermidis]MCD8804830.1 anaerobic ribonucleoside-triphosphate reductase activating protein [Staphylococcus warneri]MCD8807098.1 anaerobic ribonucleoside-triphosphate reductase activating protein [Staphylococcus warneri]PTI60500.1 anaerobic ribonucleoside-triphosphate reductase activating protein [Staphyloco